MSYRLKRFVRRHTLFNKLPPRGRGYVFVVGGYVPNGGTFMAYTIGRILHQQFGRTPVIVNVDCESPRESPFTYPQHYPIVSIETLLNNARDDDILVVNPSFSEYFLGKRCRGIKVCYLQSFTGYRMLDCFHDLYVSVSSFVAEYVDWVYGIKSDVIPAYISLPAPADVPTWRDRPADSVFVFDKPGAAAQRALLSDFLARFRELRPDVQVRSTGGQKLPQPELLRLIRAHRYFVTLSPTEGFGLVPLEAMAQGATVVGFDGFGGRDYMRHDVNCMATPYPDLEGPPNMLAAVLSDPGKAERLAAAGQATVGKYGYDNFRDRWTHTLSKLLQEEPKHDSKL